MATAYSKKTSPLPFNVITRTPHRYSRVSVRASQIPNRPLDRGANLGVVEPRPGVATRCRFEDATASLRVCTVALVSSSSFFSSISFCILACSTFFSCRRRNVVSKDSLIEKNIGPNSANHSPSTAVTHDMYSLVVLINS